ncbi:hypothetical protein GCM10010124_18700 [Pilimelia terevasa]|uniref:Uncharacterized protein n=1 Tax=Pilimelia terevasa TaxID=53372 RepID=A0A8J3BT73_9ACTN|nr:iron transporter [Pilimelia terevasa]GGK26310.1 hypothetical protein GCM10010124_18700 [Pilimelia terevasa]
MVKAPLAVLAAAVLTLSVGGCCTRKKPPATAAAGAAAGSAALDRDIRDGGGQTTMDEWRVAYVVGRPQGWQQLVGGVHTFRAPLPTETHHVAVVPIEAATGRIVPDVPVTLQVLDSAGTVVDQRRLWFLHRADYYRYGHNVAVPTPGAYTLKVVLGTPTFARVAAAAADVPALNRGTVAVFPNVAFGR